MNQPNRFTRWLDRLADAESRATNLLLWFLIVSLLVAGALASHFLQGQVFIRLAGGFSIFVVALFPLENRFKEHPKFPSMSVVPHDAQSSAITYGSYAYYDAKGEPIPDMVIQYREYNRAKFIHFPLGLFVCMSVDWIALAL